MRFNQSYVLVVSNFEIPQNQGRLYSSLYSRYIFRIEMNLLIVRYFCTMKLCAKQIYQNLVFLFQCKNTIRLNTFRLPFLSNRQRRTSLRIFMSYENKYVTVYDMIWSNINILYTNIVVWTCVYCFRIYNRIAIQVILLVS